MSEETSAVTGRCGPGRPLVLLATPAEGMEGTAAGLASRLNLTVDLASTRSAALRLLDRRVYTAMVLDQALVDADPDGAALLWKHAAHAVLVQVNFALAGAARVERELRNALMHRQREVAVAAAAAAVAVHAEIRDAVTGLLFESSLALAEEDLSGAARARVERLAGIAGRLQQLLTPLAETHAPAGSLRP
jgi:hypothetical protein